MEKIVLVFGLVLASSCQFLSYAEYIAEFDPGFPSSEASLRQSNFANTINFLEDLYDSNETRTWTANVTKFAAWSPSEI